MENLHQHFKDKPFIVLAISVAEDHNTVKNYINKYGYSFLNLLDEDSITANSYGIRSHPVKFLIDKDGNLIAQAQGYRQWDSREMKDLIEILLSNPYSQSAKKRDADISASHQ